MSSVISESFQKLHCEMYFVLDVVEAHCCVKMNGSQLQEQNTQQEGPGGGGGGVRKLERFDLEGD